MKRKPSAVSVVLFILLFVILYFVEQKLHILTDYIEPGIDMQIQEAPMSQADHKLRISG